MTRTVLRYLAALSIAASLVLLVDLCTNTISPQFDAAYYVQMAEAGILGNEDLHAPFAYRPLVPLVCGFVARAFELPTTAAFGIVSRLAAVLLLVSVFVLSQAFTTSFARSVVVMAFAAFAAPHVKIPVFFPTLVDVVAFPLVVLAMWALLRKRWGLCLLISIAGLLTKEFAAVPWLLLCAVLARAAWRERSRRAALLFLLSVGSGLAVLVLPRLLLPVAGTFQFVDPINEPESLRRLATTWLDEGKMFNILYSIAGYCLPMLLLLTPRRFERVVKQLQGPRLRLLGAYCAFVILLTVYGGTNSLIFAAYLLPVQTVFLAASLDYEVGWVEMAYALVAVLLFNKIFLPIPLPSEGFETYVDFYGGWSSRVSTATLMRTIWIQMAVVLAILLRSVTGKSRLAPPASV